jgi:hypothetical protein
MIWFSDRQESAVVFGPRQVKTGIRGWDTLNASFISLALLKCNHEGVCYRICQVCTLAAMGLLWALEKGYYAAHHV